MHKLMNVSVLLLSFGNSQTSNTFIDVLYTNYCVLSVHHLLDFVNVIAIVLRCIDVHIFHYCFVSELWNFMCECY